LDCHNRGLLVEKQSSRDNGTPKETGLVKSSDKGIPSISYFKLLQNLLK
jgi:hypothetical protein